MAVARRIVSMSVPTEGRPLKAFDQLRGVRNSGRPRLLPLQLNALNQFYDVAEGGLESRVPHPVINVQSAK